MEQLKNHKPKREKAPRVPIKTYKWEDIRRARLRGGYPWTYLYKDPFDEEIDPSQYKMEEVTKSISSPNLDTSTEKILDVTNGIESEKTSHEHLAEPSGYIVITELPSDSETHSKIEEQDTSIIIQEENSDKEMKDVEPRPESESSDNISQYLDKDEVTVVPSTAATTSKMEVPEENGQRKRAKSEEPKRKRKLSIDSSYSRKSLSKLGIIKKLKEAKEKLKVPKLNLPKGIKKEEKKPDETPPEKKQTESLPFPVVNQKPVYIHIPLKPPEGQTDEFSYLEFSDKVIPPPEPEKTVKDKSPTNSNRSSKIQEEQDESMENPSELPETPHPGYDTRRFSGHPDEIVAIEILRAQSIDLDGMPEGIGQNLSEDIFIVEQDPNDPNGNKDDVIVILSGNENKQGEQKPLSRQSSKKSLSRQSSKKSLSRQSSKRKSRAKSAEPERRRKLSLESRKSLSKLGIMKKLKDAKDKVSNFLSPSSSKAKSKSESELVKKEEVKEEIKEEKVPHSKNEPKYIHIPLKPPPGQTDEFSYLEFEEKKEPEPQKVEPEKEPKIEEQSSIESPTQTNDVQFIFLTPPSDDEILDTPDVPETPSSEVEIPVEQLKKIAKGAVDKVSPESKRKLAAVSEEQKTDDTTSNQVEKMVVDEEDGLKSTEMTSIQKEQKEEEIALKEGKKEDGAELKEKKEADLKEKKEAELKEKKEAELKEKKEAELKEKKEAELKSSLKGGSPVLKKKVSFKRRSRDESKDGIYEDVSPPQNVENLTDEQKNKLQALQGSQSMSVDEEKSYLDEKIIKSTSLEEDYNRWSKISDHEYEPINPPPDDISPPPSVQIAITDATLSFQPVQHETQTNGAASLKVNENIGSKDPEVAESYNAEQVQAQLEETFFKPSPKKTETIVKQKQIKEIKVKETKKKEAKPKDETPGKFQTAIKNQADKFRTKLHSIKKPNPKFSKPNFQKFKFEKPKINLPKMPDTSKINLPTFNIARKNSAKRSLNERQFSTESNVGDSKKHNYFDFSTYPRIFKKKTKKSDLDSSSSKNDTEIPSFATIPRSKRNQEKSPKTNDRWGGRDTIRIPLHPEDSFESNNDNNETPSHIRYDEDIDIDEAYEKENQEIHAASKFSSNYNSRWDHGSFHPDPTMEFKEIVRGEEVTDLDLPEDVPQPQQQSFDSNNQHRDAVHSSESSLGIHRRGVLEEIDSDEFFLRQKGISQDNIEIGMYLNSEIREAFKSPSNALSDLQRDQPFAASNQSLPETTTTPKKKSIKKPKRKKTPHVSQEKIQYDQDDTEPEEFLGTLPPARPKRRSKRSKKPKNEEHIIPYQETIPLDVEKQESQDLKLQQDIISNLEDEIVQDDDSYLGPDLQYHQRYDSEEEQDVTGIKEQPEIPPRRNRSLNFSEHDSILDEQFEKNIPSQESNIYRTEHEYIIPTPEGRPPRPSRFRSRSNSYGQESSKNSTAEPPVRPTRTRSRSKTRSQNDEKDQVSIVSSEPCVEEPCVQDFRDYMGYAVIDKNQKREPPLPPPRGSSKRKEETKFFTVPRHQTESEPPVRPIRNYSTLGPSRPPRKKHVMNMTDEEKENIENIDITQYIEIEEEPNRDLVSGEVIQKMRDRPLPAPPRPPRKSKNAQEDTFMDAEDDNATENIESVERTEIPENVETYESSIETRTDNQNGVTIERRLITPTHYTYNEETITHGSLVVEPLNGAKILPDSQLIKEKPKENIIQVTRDYTSDEETSEIPEEFKKLKDPVTKTAKKDSEVEVLKAQKLQVTDLDVDRLNVNELLANRIIVSEIDSNSILANDISARAGPVRVGEIELPPSVLQQIIEKIQGATREQPQTEKPTEEVTEDPSKDDTSEQKKTPIEHVDDVIEISHNLEPELSQEPQTISLPVTDEEIICEDDANQNELVIVANIEEQEEEKNFSEAPVRSDSQEENEEQINIPEPPIRSDSQKIVEEQLQSQVTEVDESNILNEEEERLLKELQLQYQIDDDPSNLEEKIAMINEEKSSILNQEEKDLQPKRPPRQSEKPKDIPKPVEPEIDDEPPPRPPQPASEYIMSQPPASFYALRAQQFVDNIDDNIPLVPRRRRHRKTRVSLSSSSDESPQRDRESLSRRKHRTPEPSIPELAGQLALACGSAANNGIKRLIAHISHNVLRNDDGNQDLHIVVATLLIFIIALLLFGYGGEKTVHHHHWEYFNPPRDL